MKTLEHQLADYGEFQTELHPPITPDELTVRFKQPDLPLIPSPRTPRRVYAVAAAVAIVALVGGMAWLFQGRTNDEVIEQTTSTVPQIVTPVGSLVGPGSWSVAASLVDLPVSADMLATAADELRAWPGVVDVALAPDAASWLELTGLEADCPSGSRQPPCGAGIVALVVDEWMLATAQRAGSELGMEAITPIDVPQAFVEGYYAAVLDRASPAPLEFDPSSLGRELPLVGPFVGYWGEQCGQRCDILVELELDGSVFRLGMELWPDEFRGDVSDDPLAAPLGAIELALAGGGLREQLVVAEGGGIGFELDAFLIDEEGRGGVIATNEGRAGTQLFALAGLPIDAAVVTQDGSGVWQRPLGGMALIPDLSGGETLVLDADGIAIMRIDEAGGVDLRVEPTLISTGDLRPPTVTTLPSTPPPDSPTTDAESQLATDVTSAVVGEVVTPSLLGDINWTVLDFEVGRVPCCMYVAAPSGVAAFDWQSGRLLLSEDLVEWQDVAPSAAEWFTESGHLILPLRIFPRFEQIPSGYRLVTRSGDWESEDLVSWHRSEPPTMVIPAISGFAVRTGATRTASVTANGVTLEGWDSFFSVEWEEVLDHFPVDWEEIASLVATELPERPADDPGFIGGKWRPWRQVLEINFYPRDRDASDGEITHTLVELELVVTGSNDDWAVELVSADTGEPVGSITGSLLVSSLDEVPDLIASGYFARTYVLSSGDDVESIEPEWSEAERASDDGVVLVAVNGEFFAHIRIGHTNVPGDNQIWRSRDGRTWENIGSPPWPNTYEIFGTPVTREGDAMLTVTDGRERSAYWIYRSDDGINWTPLGTEPHLERIHATISGWVSVADGFIMSTSRDGEEWQQVNIDGLRTTNGFLSVSDDLIVIVTAEGNRLAIGEMPR